MVFIAVGLFLLVLFWLGTQALRGFVIQEEDYEAKRSLERVEIRDRVLEQANADLNRYAWKDRDKNLVQLPIDRAMELTVASLRQNNELKPANFIDPLKAAAEQEQTTPPATEASAPESTDATPPVDAIDAAVTVDAPDVSQLPDVSDLLENPNPKEESEQTQIYDEAPLPQP